MTQTNIDPSEIHKFTPFAAHWWDPSGELKTLHAINPLRTAYIQEKTDLKGQHVIDIGCGGGLLTESMAQAGAHVTGIDMNDAALEVARLHLLESHLEVHYLRTTAEEMALQQPAQYDIVTCLEMLEHVPDPAAIIRAAATLVKPNGHVFFSTLNRNMKSYVYAILGAEYLLKLLPRNTHDFSKFIRPSELTAWAREAGLTLIHMIGIHYNPFTQHYSLGSDVSVNYMAYFKK